MPLNPTLEEQRQALARRAQTNYWVQRAFWVGAIIGAGPALLILAVVLVLTGAL